jgi:hypothetical protein
LGTSLTLLQHPLKVTNQFLLFGIHANNGMPRRHEAPFDALDVTKLLVSLGMLSAGNGLAIGFEGVLPLLQ